MSTHLKIFIIVTIAATVIGQESIKDAVHNYNLDISTFQFFKYPGVLTPYGVRRPNTNPSLHQKAKAVYRYFRNIVLGHPLQQENFGIVFNEGRALQLRAAYQWQFGYRGENLIALIGNGHSPQELRYYGAIGRDFGPY